MAVKHTVVLLLIQFVLINGQSDPIRHSLYSNLKQHFVTDPYPPKWNQAPSSVSDYPLKELNKGVKYYVIDPWKYTQRLGIYKIMIIKTEDYFKQWGFNNTGNLLWGLPLQFGWQMTSQRLHVQAHPLAESFQDGSQEINPESWWADMNYYLSVIPFLGAVTAGVVPKTNYPFVLLLPKNVTIKLRHKFCTSVTQCESRFPDLMAKWTMFFSQLTSESNDGHVQMDKVVGLLWDAHTTSIAIGKVIQISLGHLCPFLVGESEH